MGKMLQSRVWVKIHSDAPLTGGFYRKSVKFLHVALDAALPLPFKNARLTNLSGKI